MKTPQQILAASAAAMGRAQGYALVGTLFQNHHSESFQLTESTPRSVEMTSSIGPTTYQVIEVPAGYYVWGNLDFWRQKVGDARAGILAERWIEVPASRARAGISQLGKFAPAMMSRCMLEDHGTLSIAGKTTVRGQPAVLLRDAGDRPGSEPSVLAVATSGPPYPLRMAATGPQRAGGRVDACNSGKAIDLRGTMWLSFGDVVSPLAPTDVIHLRGGPTA